MKLKSQALRMKILTATRGRHLVLGARIHQITLLKSKYLIIKTTKSLLTTASSLKTIVATTNSITSLVIQNKISTASK